MLIIKIIGGLGNQMFQYAYAKALQKKKYDVQMDITIFDTYKLHEYGLDKYNISLKIANVDEINKFHKKNIFSKIFNKLRLGTSNRIEEKSLLFDKNLQQPNDTKYVEGYFQSEKYFSDIRDILLKEFLIKNDLSTYAKEVSGKIKESQISCSLHIRRGDYISDKNTKKIHGTCDLDYYKKAIALINDKFKDIKYFIFSDDIYWVKENLKIKNAIYIDSEEKRIPHEDIYLMSICKHNIIANSSFSWWGAWLNQNDEKIVITPKRWFADEKMEEEAKDIIPSNWQRI